MQGGITDRLFGERSSVAVKAPVVAATNVNIPLTSLASIGIAGGGSYAPSSGDRILVMAQADATANGIYNASTAAWTRTGDFDGANDCVQGTLVPVGTALPVVVYQLTTANPVIGTSALAFTAWSLTGIPVYQQTPAEQTAGVVPANLGYGPDHLGADVRRYGAIDLTGATDCEAILNTANSVGGALYFPKGTYRISSALALSVPLYFEAGAVLKPDAAITVTINAPIVAFATQIFNLANAGALIRGSFGGADLIPQWWGAVADGDFNAGTGTDNTSAFQAALNTAAARANLTSAAPNRIAFPPGVYKQASQVTVTDGMSIQGAGPYATIIYAPTAFATAGGLWAINGATGIPTHMDGFGIIGQVGGCGGSGIVSTKNGVFLSNLWVAAFTGAGSTGITISNTDNFLTNFVCELNLVGVSVTQSDVTVSNGKFYQNIVCGVDVNNSGAGDTGRVTLSALRSFSDGQQGFLCSGAKHVSHIGCDVASNLNAKYSDSAFRADACTDILYSGCSAIITAGASTAPGIKLTGACSGINIAGCSITGFYDGLQSNNTANMTASGNQFLSCSRNGALLTAGGPITMMGNFCTGNGAAGIDSENTAGSGFHNLVGNTCTLNTTYGIIANCGATAVTNVQANMARGNTSGQYEYLGTVANINEGAAPTNF